MQQAILEQILLELQSLRDTTATKDDLKSLRESMNNGLSELKQLITNYHSENITADEMLLQLHISTNEKLDQHLRMTKDQFATHEHAIGILHRNQLKIETELEKIKNR